MNRIRKLKRKRKKIVGLMALAFAITGIGLVGKSEAAATAAVGVKVTVSPNLSISVNTNEYNFGSMAVSATSISTSAIVITNDTVGRTEDYQVTGASTTNWAIGNSPGVDTFSLRALLNSTQPSDGAFTAVFSTLSTAIANMSAGNYGGNQNGDNVGTGGTRSLWFRMQSPSETSSGNQQTVSVTLTAADAGTF